MKEFAKGVPVRSVMYATDHLPHGHFIVEFVDGYQVEFEHFSQFGAWLMDRLRDTCPSIKEQNVALKQVLIQSVAVIKRWHGADLELQEDKWWKIYYDNAPEMKPIREALKP